MIIGVDVGTQSLKVVVVDEQWTVKGSAQVRYAVTHPHPGWAEQDPLEWEDALGTAIARSLADANVDGAAIEALAVCGQLDGCVPVDENCRPQGPCLIWMDRRAVKRMPSKLPARFRERTGIVADAGHMAPKIAWLSDRGIGARYHQPVSYLVERLVGESVMDTALASTTMLKELGRDRFSDELCAVFDIDPGGLPRIAPAASIAGRLTRRGADITGLPPGRIVAVGTGDDFASPLGAGIVNQGTMVVVLGTAEVVGAVSRDATIDEQALVETHEYFGGRYFISNPGWLSGGAVAWARRVFGFSSDGRLDAAAANVEPGCDGLVFIPALTGAMAPVWNPSIRGCFYGLTPSHGRDALARAVLEGCSYAMYDVLQRLRGLGLGPERIVAIGGGAASAQWLQMRADLAGIAVEGISGGDSCALGAAVLAATAAGLVDSEEEGANQLRFEARLYHPDPNVHAVMLEAYQGYRSLFAAVEGM